MENNLVVCKNELIYNAFIKNKSKEFKRIFSPEDMEGLDNINLYIIPYPELDMKEFKMTILRFKTKENKKADWFVTKTLGE